MIVASTCSPFLSLFAVNHQILRITFGAWLYREFAQICSQKISSPAELELVPFVSLRSDDRDGLHRRRCCCCCYDLACHRTSG